MGAEPQTRLREPALFPAGPRSWHAQGLVSDRTSGCAGGAADDAPVVVRVVVTGARALATIARWGELWRFFGCRPGTRRNTLAVTRRVGGHPRAGFDRWNSSCCSTATTIRNVGSIGAARRAAVRYASRCGRWVGSRDLPAAADLHHCTAQVSTCSVDCRDGATAYPHDRVSHVDPLYPNF
jgi:hypothetical protein